MKVGVLALQGAVEPHARALERVGASPVEVRSADDLDGLGAVVLPGGESTTIGMLLARSGLDRAVVERAASGVALLGTCAGMILLADRVMHGRPDQVGLGLIDLAVRRNGFGRQRESFETSLRGRGLAEPMPAVFMRGPVVEQVGPGVEVLAELDGRPVLCRQGRVLVSSFHPELSGDDRIHALFVGLADVGPVCKPGG